MAMSQSTLASNLETLEPSDSATVAANRIADAYDSYASDAQTSTTNAPLLPAGRALGKTAMVAALIAEPGLSSPGAAVGILVSAHLAFWAAVAGGLTTSFLGATAIVPPLFTSLSTNLTADFLANTNGSKSLEDSVDDIADSIHSGSISGGTVTIGAVVEPII